MDDSDQPLLQSLRNVLRDVLRPLIEADNGKLYLVSITDEEIVLHLGGACSGCPGVPITLKTLIEPVVHGVAPNIKVVVTNGAKEPRGMILVAQDSSDGSSESVSENATEVSSDVVRDTVHAPAHDTGHAPAYNPTDDSADISAEDPTHDPAPDTSPGGSPVASLDLSLEVSKETSPDAECRP